MVYSIFVALDVVSTPLIVGTVGVFDLEYRLLARVALIQTESDNTFDKLQHHTPYGLEMRKRLLENVKCVATRLGRFVWTRTPPTSYEALAEYFGREQVESIEIEKSPMFCWNYEQQLEAGNVKTETKGALHRASISDVNVFLTSEYPSIREFARLLVGG